MPFVFVNTVRIENVDQAREALQTEVIPGVKLAPGFIHGIWSADRGNGRGTGFVVFKTREQAEALAQTLASGEMKPPPGVTVESSAVYELQGEA